MGGGGGYGVWEGKLLLKGRGGVGSTSWITLVYGRLSIPG